MNNEYSNYLEQSMLTEMGKLRWVWHMIGRASIREAINWGLISLTIHSMHQQILPRPIPCFANPFSFHTCTQHSGGSSGFSPTRNSMQYGKSSNTGSQPDSANWSWSLYQPWLIHKELQGRKILETQKCDPYIATVI